MLTVPSFQSQGGHLIKKQKQKQNHQASNTICDFSQHTTTAAQVAEGGSCCLLGDNVGTCINVIYKRNA